MDRTLFFDGQDVLVADINNVETTKIAAILRRGYDFATQTGIITGLTVTHPANFILRVAPGVGYNANGEAIVVTANSDITVSVSDVGALLVIRATTTDNTAIEHPVTGVLNNTRRVSGYVLVMTATPLATDVVLAELTALTGGGAATINVLESPPGPRVYWSARIAKDKITDVMIDDGSVLFTHINTFGTGTVTGDNPHGLSPADIGFTVDTTPTVHQQRDHSNGIEPQSSVSAGLVTVAAGPAPDQLTITQLAGSDSFLIDGLRIATLTPTTFTFGAAPTDPSLYWITVNSAGTTAAEIRAQYSAAKTVLGVQIIDVSDGHVAGSRALFWDVSASTLQWDSGPTVLIAAPSGNFIGDTEYKLYRPGATGWQYITVHVDYSALPLTDQTDNVVISVIATTTKLVLASVPWSGTATGFLGYGDQGASGVALDKRQYGNLGETKLTDSYRDLIELLLKENNDNGFLAKFTMSDNLLDVTLAKCVAYVAGKRFELNETVLSVTDNTTNWIFVNPSGQWQFTNYNPSLIYSDFALAMTITMDAGSSDGQSDLQKIIGYKDVVGDYYALTSRAHIKYTEAGTINSIYEFYTVRDDQFQSDELAAVLGRYIKVKTGAGTVTIAAGTGTYTLTFPNALPASVTSAVMVSTAGALSYSSTPTFDAVTTLERGARHAIIEEQIAMIFFDGAHGGSYASATSDYSGTVDDSNGYAYLNNNGAGTFPRALAIKLPVKHGTRLREVRLCVEDANVGSCSMSVYRQDRGASGITGNITGMGSDTSVGGSAGLEEISVSMTHTILSTHFYHVIYHQATSNGQQLLAAFISYDKVSD